MRAFCLAALWLALASPLAAAEWRDNLTREQVIAALGRPQSDVRAGGRESMAYPGGLTIELQNGVVSRITGTVPEVLKPGYTGPVSPPVAAPAAVPANPPPAAAASAPAAKPAAPVATAEKPPEKKEDFDNTIEEYAKSGIVPPGTSLGDVVKKQTSQVAGPAANDATAKATDLLSKLVPKAQNTDADWKRPDNLIGFAAGFFIKLLVMAAVLKGVFLYKDFPVLWREILLVAGGVALCNQGLAYLFTLNAYGEIAAMVQADQIVAAGVMLTLIMNFTSAKSFPTAAGITLAAIGANIAVGYAMFFFL